MQALLWVAAHPLLSVCAAATIPALLGLPALARNVLRSALGAAQSALLMRKVLNNRTTAIVVESYLRSLGRSVNLGSDVVDVKYEPSVRRHVAYQEAVRSPRLFWYGGRPVRLRPEEFKKDNDGDEQSSRNAELVYVRGTVDFGKLVARACEYYDALPASRQRRHYVWRVNGDGGSYKSRMESAGEGPASAWHWRVPINATRDELAHWDPSNSLGELSLGERELALVRDVRFWADHESWYDTRGVPWRRGYLLYGKPGTGKTSLIRALAEDLDLPVFVLDLASLNNRGLTEAWSMISGFSRKIVLLEDFDTIFKHRTNLVPESKLTFEALLNCIDGIERNRGLLLFVTTNAPESIDPALGVPTADGQISTRPGRLDVVFEMSDVNREGLERIAERILDAGDPGLDKLVDEGASDTPAQFVERCRRHALADLYREGSL